MKQIEKEDLATLKSRLDIHVSNSSDALQNIIKIDNHFNLKGLFYKYFYVTNSTLEKQEKNFYDSLSDKCQFKVIHGYSKNGKTTFINHIVHSNNVRSLDSGSDKNLLELIHFDFEKPGLGKHDNRKKVGTFIDKLKFFYLKNFNSPNLDKRIDLNLELNKFDTFCSRFYERLIEEGLDDIAQTIRPNLFAINGIFAVYLKETNNGNHGDPHWIELKLEELVINKINENSCGEYFIFLIFWELFKRRDKILVPENNYKFLYILDNIDDYLVNKDVSFMQHPQIHLSSILYQLSSIPHLNRLFVETLTNKKDSDRISFSFLRHIKIVYIFRTPNFLVFSNIIQKLKDDSATSSEKHFSSLLSKKEYTHLKTIGNTSVIFSHRLERYKEICEKLDMPLSKGYYFLKSLSDNFDSSKSSSFENNIRRIFNLWNGDKSALWHSITNNWDTLESRYFKFEELIFKLSNKDIKPEFYKYLLKGTYINFFLYLLKQNPDLNDMLYQTIYSFREDHSVNEKKNIRRLIINCIINISIQNGKPTCIDDIEKKGIGLYDLLFEIDNYINNVNQAAEEEIYSFQEVEDYFSEICSLKIDHFAQLFSIYKDQIVIDNEQEASSNYYDFNEEIVQFKNERADCKTQLNKIRIFNNHSATYISASLLTNYELCSHICYSKSGEFNLPLLFHIKRSVMKKEPHSIENFDFYKVTEQVFEQASISVKSMVEFYCAYLIKKYPPETFIECELFTVLDIKSGKGDFQTRLLVSRHITYINAFRDVILNHSHDILEMEEQEKIIINEYLLNLLKRYHKLYLTNLSLIEELYPLDDYHPLIVSKKAFLTQNRKIDYILENNKSDFRPLEEIKF